MNAEEDAVSQNQVSPVAENSNGHGWLAVSGSDSSQLQGVEHPLSKLQMSDPDDTRNQVVADHASLQPNHSAAELSQQMPLALQGQPGRRHSVDSNIGRSRQPTFIRTYKEVKWTRINTPTTRVSSIDRTQGADGQVGELREYITGTHITRRRVPIFIASNDLDGVPCRRFSAGDLIPVAGSDMHLTPNEKCLIIRDVLSVTRDMHSRNSMSTEGATRQLGYGHCVEGGYDLYQFSLIDEGDEDDGSDEEEDEDNVGRSFTSASAFRESNSHATVSNAVVATPRQTVEAVRSDDDRVPGTSTHLKTMVNPSGCGSSNSNISLISKQSASSPVLDLPARSPVTTQANSLPAASQNDCASDDVGISSQIINSITAQSPVEVVPSLSRKPQMGATNIPLITPRVELPDSQPAEQAACPRTHSHLPCRSEPDDSSWVRTSTKIAGSNVLVSSYHPRNSAISTTSVHWQAPRIIRGTIPFDRNEAAAICVEHITVPIRSETEPLHFQRVTYASERICCSARWVSPKEIADRTLSPLSTEAISSGKSFVLSPGVSIHGEGRPKSSHKYVPNVSTSVRPTSLHGHHGRTVGVGANSSGQHPGPIVSNLHSSLNPWLFHTRATEKLVPTATAVHDVNGQTAHSVDNRTAHSLDSRAIRCVQPKLYSANGSSSPGHNQPRAFSGSVFGASSRVNAGKAEGRSETMSPSSTRRYSSQGTFLVSCGRGAAGGSDVNNRLVSSGGTAGSTPHGSASRGHEPSSSLTFDRQADEPLRSNRQQLEHSGSNTFATNPSCIQSTGPGSPNDWPTLKNNRTKPRSMLQLGSETGSCLSVTEKGLISRILRSLSDSPDEADALPREGSSVAIDNKIEQAMDLVKRHLMYAVREEVEILKQQIGELVERIGHLEYENTVLRSEAKPETLNKLLQTRVSQTPQTSLPAQSSSFTISQSSQQSQQTTTPHSVSQVHPSPQSQQTTTPQSVSQAHSSQQSQQLTAPHPVSQAHTSQQSQQSTSHPVSQVHPSQQSQQTTSPLSVSLVQPSQQTST